MPETNPSSRSHAATKTLAAVGVGAIALYGARVLLNFFGPELPYAMSSDPGCALDSEDFTKFLSVVTDGTVRRSRMTRLKDGAAFYPAEMAAIRGARHSINLEVYEFLEGEVADEMLAAMTERARAGVAVKLVIDAIGSFRTRLSYFDTLRAAGGRMHWYHPLHWDTWQKANNRTHRKLLIVDAEIGFIGGAGVADFWIRSTPKVPVWRDTMFQVEGESVAGLVSAFSENWLESSGEILSGRSQFDVKPVEQGATSFVVSSTPHGGGTQARILFQALIKSACKSIRITTPYFLPDRSARHALVEAVQKRGVSVQIITAGPKIDHPIIRRLSRQSSWHLLTGGAEIFEYQPSMIHAKLMTVDGMWSVVGSTNFDHRSFALNDEVNLAVLDRELAEVIEADFMNDLRNSKRVTLKSLKEQPLLGRGPDVLGQALEEES